MPNLRETKWYKAEHIRNSPSVVDGMPEALEKEYRRKTSLFIKASGKELELPVDAVATALVFFHRFFMRHSFQRHDRVFVGSACLFLAAKVEESPKRVEHVMSKCWKVWQGGREPPAEHEKAFKRLREKILIAERCVLHTLGFQLTVEHPYSTVMSLLKKLFTLGRGANGGKGVNKARNRQLSQAANSFVNDSLLTTVCIQYRPNQVAAAVVYLSYLYMGLPRVDTTLLEVDSTVVAEICDAILALYDEQQPERAAKLVKDVRDKLKRRIASSASPPDSVRTAGVSAGSTATSSSPPPLPPPATTSPRPPPSPRPTPSPSPKTKGEPSSSSSSSVRQTAASACSSDGAAAAVTGRQDDAASSGGVRQGVRGGVAGRGGEGERGGTDGGHDKKGAVRRAEEGRRHHRSPRDRDSRDSPPRTGVAEGGGGRVGRKEVAGKPSAKRKSGEGGVDLEEGGREGQPPVVEGAVETKRQKTASSS